MYSKSSDLPPEIKEVCSNLLKDSNKTIHLEKLLSFLSKNQIYSLLVWESNGIPILLLQEVVNPYFELGTQSFNEDKAKNLILVLKILEILLLEDKSIKKVFVDSCFHYYLYKYITIYEQAPVYENLRKLTLNVLYALLHNSDLHVHNQMKNTEIVPIILKSIDLGTEAVKIQSIDLFFKIVSSEDGLNYACQTFDRFSAINQVLNSVMYHAVQIKSSRIIKSIIRVYLRLCDKQQIRTNLSASKPDNLSNEEIKKVIQNDPECCKMYKEFLEIIKK
ncbi:Cell differentiation protein RCD1 [Nosema bombycis CQ1]|uniref:Cell differentiation protein RCD1 n=1 Tax=Nosema bombycis (strain CQ1 / CVCC 102059) TaxID=578461 RepID=R0M3T9_NOSB1|nr:Cell differentiation protein RCD1 [Nosema bombycis CQ1]|eukprot:EOB12694.1 Cell differentiation protein RCD1 [Nosema bombycis CQ1]